MFYTENKSHIPYNPLREDIVRADLNKKIFFCLAANGYPPQYNDEVFNQVMKQVENFKNNN